MTLLWILLFLGIGLSWSIPYYGSRIGPFSTHFHDVKGEVYAVDDKTLFIRGFNYDGKGQDAVFWAGSSIRPDNTGFIIPNHKASFEPLPEYSNKDLILRMPEGKKIQDIHWLSVWSKKHSTSFGTLIFPNNLTPPRPHVIGPLENTKNGVSSGDILVLDTQTFLVPDFSYDGAGKSAYWWASRGLKQNMGGVQLREEGGSDGPLKPQKNKISVITLPEGHSVFDYNFLSVWSTVEVDDYGTVKIPNDLKVPPSPRTLASQEDLETSKFNCEMLNDNLGLEVRWLINGDDITMRLVGNIDASEYMALGLSKDDTETRFDASDAVVAWQDSDGTSHVADYFLENMEKCINGYGMCPDTFHEGSGDNLKLLNSVTIDNTTIITFKRPLKAVDQKHDQNIYTDGPQAILWAVGTIENDGLAGPPKFQTRGNLLLDFGREPNWNCPPPKEEISSSTVISDNAFGLPPKNEALHSTSKKDNGFEIHCPSDRTFRAQMGTSPVNGLKVWYINGLPAPNLTVQRGKSYNFIIEGGISPPSHHPFYITNNQEGGIYQSILEGKEGSEELYAGVLRDPETGSYVPIAEGRLCEWKLSEQDPKYSVYTLSDLESPTLSLQCEAGEAGKLSWTPQEDIPKTVYYQSFTERNRGGKIKIVDFCEETNPLHYVENEAGIMKKTLENPHRIKLGLEREDDASDLTFLFNPKDAQGNPKLDRNDPGATPLTQKNAFLELIPEVNSENLPTFSSMEEMISYFSGTNENHGGKSEVHSDHKFSPDDETNSKDYLVAENSKLKESEVSASDSLLPHDESERSDKLFRQRLNAQEMLSRRNKVKLGSHRGPESSQGKRPINIASKSNQQSHITQPPPGFKPQFEGGFVPLVMNSGKEKESVLSKDFVLPPPHMRRPYRPFLFNESIPFHGTFKPGVPDFSGFNISNYSQEDSSYPLNHVQDNLPLFSVPKPQVIQRPMPIMNGLPPELFNRPKGSLSRPHIFGYQPRPQNPGFGGQQQRIFAQLPLQNRPSQQPVGIPISNGEDLSEVSSQRVQVALQLPGSDKGKKDEFLQVMRVPGRKLHPEVQGNKIIKPPIIQRRPDIVEEGATSNNPNQFKQSSQGKGFPPRLPTNKHINQQLPSPAAQPGGMRGILNRPHSFPAAKQSFNTPGNGFRRLPTVPPRNPHPFLQRPVRERFHLFPGQHKIIPHREPAANEHEIKIIEAISDATLISGDKRNRHIQRPRPSIKLLDRPDESAAVEEIDSSTSKEMDGLPLFLNPDFIEPNKIGTPQLILLRPHPLENPGLIIHTGGQNLPETAKNTHPTLIDVRHNPPQQFTPSDNEENSLRKVQPTEIPANAALHPSETSHLPGNPPKELIDHNKAKNNDISLAKDVVDIIKNSSETFPMLGGVNAHSVTNEDKIGDHVEVSYSEHIVDEQKLEIHPSEFDKPDLHSNHFENIDQETVSVDAPEPNENSPTEFTSLDKDTDEAHYVDDDTEDSTLDYDDYNVPFGARLKLSPDGATDQSKASYLIPKRPGDFLRKPHFPPSKTHNKDIATSPFITTNSSSSKFEPVLESIAPETAAYQPNQKSSAGIDTSKSVHSISQITPKKIFNTSLYFNYESPSREFPKMPSSASEMPVAKYPGRKNILPNHSTESSHHSVPAKVPENINLPHISENPPTHDNGTDYSILNHVLSLIGSPSGQSSGSSSSGS